MNKSLLAILALFAIAHCMSGPEYGTYILLTNDDATEKMDALASGTNLPFNRIYIAFIRPDMVYESQSLKSTGLKFGSDSDMGFSVLKNFVTAMRGKGIEVMLSLGGWDWSCYPGMYMKNSIGAYNPSPNYWKITKYGGGSTSNCNESNMWCYTCEPESEPRVIDDFAIFATPSQEAIQHVKAKKYDADIKHLVPGTTHDGYPVPGNPEYTTKGSNPYRDFVQLAHDLGCSGVDLDYEEIWYSDSFKKGSGPWTNDQVIYKFAAVIQDIQLSIEAIDSTLLFSAAVTCQGADGGKWWGGNLKGQLVKVKDYFPEMMGYFTGNINVMTYDVSDNPQFHECPADQQSNCPLNKQVHYYMSQFKQFVPQVKSKVGFEIGQPAYPDVTEDKQHQLPLSKDEFQMIATNTLPNHEAGGFIWETYKPTTSAGNISPGEVLDGICSAMGGSSCQGSIPQPGPAPSSKYNCVRDQCVEDQYGPYSSKSDCEQWCQPANPKYNCFHNACVEDAHGAYDSKSDCEQWCASTFLEW